MLDATEQGLSTAIVDLLAQKVPQVVLDLTGEFLLSNLIENFIRRHLLHHARVGDAGLRWCHL